MSGHIEHDFGPEANAALEGFTQAKIALWEAWRNYHELGREITTALADEHKAPLGDIASILSLSYAEAARLLAYQPVASGLVHFHSRGLRHFVTQHAAPSIARAAAWGTRQARAIASDALREARHGRFTHRA